MGYNELGKLRIRCARCHNVENGEKWRVGEMFFTVEWAIRWSLAINNCCIRAVSSAMFFSESTEIKSDSVCS